MRTKNILSLMAAFIFGFIACYITYWYASLHFRHQVMETFAMNVISMSNLEDTYSNLNKEVFESEIVCNIITGNKEVAARAEKVDLSHERDAYTKSAVEASASAAERATKKHPNIASKCGY